jgi:hypothetical protein
VRGIARSGRGRSNYRRVPRYGHSYCTIRHLSDDTRVRCEATVKYRRMRADGIAWENAEWARERANEAEYAAWVANHPVRAHLVDYIFWAILAIALGALAVSALWIYG